MPTPFLHTGEEACKILAHEKIDRAFRTPNGLQRNLWELFIGYSEVSPRGLLGQSVLSHGLDEDGIP